MRKRNFLFFFLLWTIVYGLWTDLYACSVCFGDPNSLQSKALSGAVLFLIAVIGFVLAAIAGLALSWSRRAKQLAALENGTGLRNA